MTIDPLAQCLAMLVELYPPKPELSAQALAVYRRTLADLDADECERAFLVLSRERGRQFFPKPGEILDAARPITPGAVAAMFDRIEAEILFRRGTLSSIAAVFGVAAMEAVQAAGGVQAIRSPGEYRAVRLKEFMEAFHEAVAREPEKLGPASRPALPGRVQGLVDGLSRQMSLPTGDR